jgi:SAM-dependent methyltransferase
VAEVQGVVREQGGFDVISCCSAIVLLPSALNAVAHWAKLLKPGGRMIIDVPTEDRSLQYLFTVDLAQRLGVLNKFDRSWIENAHSLEKLFEAAGLKVEKGWRTRSYVRETAYDDGEAEEVWEGQVVKYADFMKFNEGRREDARRAFLELWRQNLDQKGRFVDGHWLYVVVGRKA